MCSRLNLLLDVLLAHRDLCARHEKGVMQDHQKAHQKMLSLKKRQMQGVLRGEVTLVSVPLFYLTYGTHLSTANFKLSNLEFLSPQSITGGNCYTQSAVNDSLIWGVKPPSPSFESATRIILTKSLELTEIKGLFPQNNNEFCFDTISTTYKLRILLTILLRPVLRTCRFARA